MRVACVFTCVIVLSCAGTDLHSLTTDSLRRGHAQEVGLSQEGVNRAAKFIEDAVAAGSVSGAALLVARHGTIVAERAFGLADRENRVPFTIETICSIASVSKPLAAAAALMLVDEGRLDLDDPIELYLPAFRGQLVTLADGKRVHRPFSLRHLLTHTSGLRVDSPLRTLPIDKWWKLTLAETVDAVANTDLVFEPGAKAQYSNIGIATVGRLIEVLSGQSFEAFMRDRLLAPLGMHDTFYNVPKALAARTAPLYFFEERGGRLVQVLREDHAGLEIVNTMPNGGAYSTVSDLAVFVQMILNGGHYAGRRILAPRTARVMIADQTPALPSRWGLGWILGAGARDRGAAPFSERTFNHPGGGRQFIWGDPDEGLLGVLLMQPAADFGPLGSRPDLWDYVGPMEGLWRRFRHLVYASIDDWTTSRSDR